MIFGDANLTVHSLAQKESKCVGFFFLIVYEIKVFFIVFTFNSAQQQCNDLAWNMQGF